MAMIVIVVVYVLAVALTFVRSKGDVEVCFPVAVLGGLMTMVAGSFLSWS